MILTIAPKGVKLKIINISGKELQKKQLADLGLIEGAEIIIVDEVNENIIIMINNRKIAISKELSNRIKVIIN